jgi:hypothetical protein
MRKWLAVTGMVPFLMATAGHAQMMGLPPADVASVARTHTIDLRLSEQHGFDRPMPLMRGMIAQQGIGPNAFVGVGLANIYGRKKGPNLRIGDPPQHSRKPAVTFVMKF